MLKKNYLTFDADLTFGFPLNHKTNGLSACLESIKNESIVLPIRESLAELALVITHANRISYILLMENKSTEWLNR